MEHKSSQREKQDFHCPSGLTSDFRLPRGWVTKVKLYLLLKDRNSELPKTRMNNKVSPIFYQLIWHRNLSKTITIAKECACFIISMLSLCLHISIYMDGIYTWWWRSTIWNCQDLWIRHKVKPQPKYVLDGKDMVISILNYNKDSQHPWWEDLKLF